MYSVKTEDELAAAVQKSKQKNSPAFGLLLEKTFFDTCQKNPSIKEAALLKGGLFSFGAACYDDDLCAYWYKQCRYKSFCIVPGALEYSSAMRVLSAGLNGAEAVALMLDDSSWKLTLRNAQYIGEWAACAGLKGVYVQKKELRAYIFGTEQDAFQPAVRILASLRNGTQDKLPAKYKKALAAARIITKNVSGNPLEMYAQIHDSLCRRITYEINPKNEDNSSCVGALVNGRAKCDGYADAFYLCCGLKGLPAAYLAGKSKARRKNTDGDNHMWNLLFLGGTWRCVDVTWDDGGEDILYDYFNIGLDRMKDAYSFTPAMIPSNMAAKTDTAERMTQEYPAESESDITDAIREMINSGKASQIPSGGSVEWSVTPTTGKYPVRISLRAGGRECAFTPLDTEPVRVVASFADRNGDIVSTSERLVTPKEFAVNISVIVDKPITLWDSSKRANYSLSPDVLMANTPVRIRAVLNPPFRGSHSFTWNVDAATALTSQDNGDIFIRRGSTGTSEISVTAFNAQGIRAGKRRKYRNNFPSCIDI